MSEKRDRWTSGYMRPGDVLLMNKGMAVHWPDCPKFLNEHHSPYMLGTCDQIVQIGVPVERKPSIDFLRKEMTSQIQGMFRYRHIPLDDYILERFINNQIPGMKIETYMVPAGLYVITSIEPSARSHQINLRTYKPNKERPEFGIFVQQGNYNPTHIDVPQIVTNPDEALEAGWK